MKRIFQDGWIQDGGKVLDPRNLLDLKIFWTPQKISDPKKIFEFKQIFGLKFFFYPNFFLPIFFLLIYPKEFKLSVWFVSHFKLNLDVRISSFLSRMENSGGNLPSKFIGKSKSRYQVWPSSAQLVVIWNTKGRLHLRKKFKLCNFP